MMTSITMSGNEAWGKTVRLAIAAIAAGLLTNALVARPQAQQPVGGAASSQHSGRTTTKKATTSTAARPAYDRALLHPALLKTKAPDTYQVKFVTTRGEF